MIYDVDVKTPQEIMAEFREWNGWGPPRNQFQIEEYLRNCSNSAEESKRAERILIAWMNGDLDYKRPSLF